jgi:branched-chain amino acid transport system permease protein
MIDAFQRKSIVDDLSFGYFVLLAIGVGFGYVAARPPPTLEGYAQSTPGSRNVLAGALGGLCAALPLLGFIWIFGNFDLRATFTNVSPAVVDQLTFEQSLPLATVLVLVITVALGTAGAALHFLPRALRKPLFAGLMWIVVFGLAQSVILQILTGLRIGFLGGLLYLPGGALKPVGAIGIGVVFFLLYTGVDRYRPRARATLQRVGLLSDEEGQRSPTSRVVILAVIAVGFFLLGALPQILGQFLSDVFNLAGIFLLMALGLNIVVGFAGLLDLGYVAFFAVGAYTTAVLTSPAAPGFSPGLSFWGALPFVIVAAIIAGVIVGTPVLRMRGDYLAIVTLGFGEIARILLVSDWLTPIFGGAQGITRIPNIQVGTVEVVGTQSLLYLVVGFILLAAYASWALQRSRVGRAWMAMREDESVAEAMGINIVATKLSAFVIGAILASFAGALWAVRIGSVFPNSFDIIVSITVLAIIIVGGIASVPGVMVGALMLVALPELLREFEEFRFLIYGALLIFMMVNRPEGFIPSTRRARELHEEEAEQDAWLRAVVETQKQEAQPASPDSGWQLPEKG